MAPAPAGHARGEIHVEAIRQHRVDPDRREKALSGGRVIRPPAEILRGRRVVLHGRNRPRLHCRKRSRDALLLGDQERVERLGRHSLVNELRLTPEQGPDEARVVGPRPGGHTSATTAKRRPSPDSGRCAQGRNRYPVHGNRLTRLA